MDKKWIKISPISSVTGWESRPILGADPWYGTKVLSANWSNSSVVKSVKSKVPSSDPLDFSRTAPESDFFSRNYKFENLPTLSYPSES